MASPFLIQIPAEGMEKAVEERPGVWAPATHVSEQEQALGSWFQPGSALAFAAV